MDPNSKEGIAVDKLPAEMILDILQRLPAKSLYRFRCVSKSWYGFICPHFDNKHQKIFHLIEAESRRCSILDYYEPTSDSVANDALVHTVESPYFLPIPSLPANAFILASCDTQLLLSSKESNKLFLLNPFTMHVKSFFNYNKFPFFPKSAKYGILYDYSSHYYTVVNVSKRFSFIRVYSQETNSWREIESLPPLVHQICNEESGVSVNGALHWVCVKEDKIQKCILGFDLKGEFKEFPLPPLITTVFQVLLGSLRGNLCAFGCTFDDDLFILMEKKEYGVEESWTKVCSIKDQWGLTPLAFTKKGELILCDHLDNELIIYNAEDNSLESLKKFNKFRQKVCANVIDKHLSTKINIATFADCLYHLDCDCWLNRVRIPSMAPSIKHCEG